MSLENEAVPSPQPSPTPDPNPSPTPSLIGGDPAAPAAPAPTPVPAVAAPPVTVADIKFPDGAVMTGNQALTDEFLGIINNDKSTPTERAQAIVDLQAKIVQAASEAGSAQFGQQQEAAIAAVMADPVIGGEKFAAVSSKIETRVFDRFGSPEQRQLFATLGIGNHLPIIQLFNKIADALGEPTPVHGGGGVNTELTNEQRAQAFYPSMQKKG